MDDAERNRRNRIGYMIQFGMLSFVCAFVGAAFAIDGKHGTALFLGAGSLVNAALFVIHRRS